MLNVGHLDRIDDVPLRTKYPPTSRPTAGQQDTRRTTDTGHGLMTADRIRRIGFGGPSPAEDDWRR